MSIINNLFYDIKAIKKYGLLTHLKYLFDYDHVIINLHFHLDFILNFEENPTFPIKEANIESPEILKQWVDIVNDAFDFEEPYNLETAKYYLNNHLYKMVKKVYFVYSNDEPIGTYFIGHFKNNPNVGCAGRFAVYKNKQRQGLGRYLIASALNNLKMNGVICYEETFNIKREYSIKLFIKCGGKPEFRKKYLQLKPARKFSFITWLARYKVMKMYKAHLKTLKESYLLKK